MRRASLALFLFSLLTVTRAQEKGNRDDPQPENENTDLRVDLETGGHVGTIVKLFFTADGKQLVSVGRDLTVRFWGVHSGELLHTLRPRFFVHPNGLTQAAAVSADRRTL